MHKAKLKPIKANPELRDQVSLYSINQYNESAPMIEKTGIGDVLCYIDLGNRWFRSSETEIDRVTKELNKEVHNDLMTVRVNDVFALLGLYQLNHYGEYELRFRDLAPFTDLFVTSYHPEGFKQVRNEPVLVIHVMAKPAKIYSEEV